VKAFKSINGVSGKKLTMKIKLVPDRITDFFYPKTKF
jgi:hypothetical protein